MVCNIFCARSEEFGVPVLGVPVHDLYVHPQMMVRTDCIHQLFRFIFFFDETCFAGWFDTAEELCAVIERLVVVRFDILFFNSHLQQTRRMTSTGLRNYPDCECHSVFFWHRFKF